jgi:energy-coupling factor transporter ATP-binding protein EcfA2
VADRLTKRFGSRTVVDAVSFDVPAGSVTGLVGPNGAGKTTIMGMLLGLEGAAFSTACLGLLAAQRGDAAEAIVLQRRSLLWAMSGNERRAMTLAVVGMAVAFVVDGDEQQAASLVGVAAAIRGIGPAIAQWVLAELDRVETACRSVLGAGGFDAAFEAGRSNAEAILSALVADQQPVLR